MSVKYSFMDNEVYGADDVNYAFSRLTAQGVSLFNYSDEDNPLVDLRDAIGEFTTEGVEYYNPEACMVTYDSDTEKYEIQPGAAFMSDGSFIVIEENPEDITDRVSELLFRETPTIAIGFYRNTQDNCIDIVVDDIQNIEEDEFYVPIAEITAGGDVADKRVIATTKIAPVSANVVKTYTFNETVIPLYGGRKAYQTFENVFPGAKYVYYNTKLHEIQSLSEDRTDELEYTTVPANISSNGLHVAFNRNGTSVDIWLYATGSNVTASEKEIVFF